MQDAERWERSEALEYAVHYYSLHRDTFEATDAALALGWRDSWVRGAKHGYAVGPTALPGKSLDDLLARREGEKPYDHHARLPGMVEREELKHAVTDESCKWMLYAASRDPQAFDAACLVASELMLLGEPLPQSLLAFAGKALLGLVPGSTGGGKRPARRGRPNLSGRGRALLVCEIVDVLERSGFPATRNDASNHRDSACDIVAEALASLGLSPGSYERVKALWLEGRQGYGRGSEY